MKLLSQDNRKLSAFKGVVRSGAGRSRKGSPRVHWNLGKFSTNWRDKKVIKPLKLKKRMERCCKILKMVAKSLFDYGGWLPTRNKVRYKIYKQYFSAFENLEMIIINVHTSVANWSGVFLYWSWMSISAPASTRTLTISSKPF